jgi:hypothetical protein
MDSTAEPSQPGELATHPCILVPVVPRVLCAYHLRIVWRTAYARRGFVGAVPAPAAADAASASASLTESVSTPSTPPKLARTVTLTQAPMDEDAVGASTACSLGSEDGSCVNLAPGCCFALPFWRGQEVCSCLQTITSAPLHHDVPTAYNCTTRTGLGLGSDTPARRLCAPHHTAVRLSGRLGGILPGDRVLLISAVAPSPEIIAAARYRERAIASV